MEPIPSTMNITSGSLGSNTSYREKFSSEDITDDEEDNKESETEHQDEDNLCKPKKGGSLEDELRNFGSPSPNTSPASRRKAACWSEENSRMFSERQNDPNVQSRMNHLSNSYLSSSAGHFSSDSDSPSQIPKGIHNSKVASPRADQSSSAGLCASDSDSPSAALTRRGLHDSRRGSQRGNIEKYSHVSQRTTYSYKESHVPVITKESLTKDDHKNSQYAMGRDVLTTQDKLHEKFDPNIILFLFIIVIVIVLLIVSSYRAKMNDQLENVADLDGKPNEILEDFLKAFDELNSSFPAQTGTFWKVLRSGTRSIIVPEYPIQPAVFIIAVPKEAEESALCVVRKYAAIVTSSFAGNQPIEFTYHLRHADTPENIKQMIDSTLNDGFSLGSRVAIIHELNKMHGKSAMMFHGYCDNENAPFTRVAFVLMLHLDSEEIEETDELVERKLSQVWGKYLDSDTLFPLLSRIGNRNAFVRRETPEVLRANGCT